jgi:phosphoenolpyruvate carboxykinase (ATP)
MMVSTIATKDRQVRLDLLLSKNPYYQLTPQQLIQQTLELGEGQLSDTGALIINTGEFTGRSPKDKFIVRDSTTNEENRLEQFQYSYQHRKFY